jgi:hypothetical protein
MNEIFRVCQEKARQGGLPLWRQLIEMAMLFIFRRMGPRYYLMARFWRKDIPLTSKWRHCQLREYERYVLSLNPLLYQKISHYKMVQKAVITLASIPTPKFLGFLHPKRGFAGGGYRLANHADLARALSKQVGKRVCFKPVQAWGGKNFVALDVVIEEQVILRHPVSGKEYSVEDWHNELMSQGEGWVLEEYLVQHPTLSEMNASSVNTIRIMAVEEQGLYRVVGAYLRVGRTGSQVDNVSRGGFACPVNLESGYTTEALDPTLSRESHYLHPDTGVRLVGRNIPFWDQCKSIACKALTAFPEMRFAGLDIAVTEHGPQVIELNVIPDKRWATHLDLPHRDLFEQVLRFG